MPTEGGSEDDRRFLQAASRLAWRHAGHTAENPSVACLLVADGRIVGRGVTALGGRPHAERLALGEAGEAAGGATAYVTLEPCAHHGRTSPCAEALAEAGVARVVIGARDPDPRVDGRGIAILKAAGIAVAILPTEEYPSAIEGFLTRSERGRPFLTLKLAVSADGFIGREGMGQVAISGAAANRQTHLLRLRSDLVMIGVGTAVADDPLLTVRLDGLGDRGPARLVVDPQLRIPAGGRLVETAPTVPLLVASRVSSGSDLARLRERSVEPLSLLEGDGALNDLLRRLASRGIASILCEGGAILGASLMRAGLVDRLILIRSPIRFGGRGIALPNLDPYLPDFILARQWRFGDDRWIEYDKRIR